MKACNSSWELSPVVYSRYVNEKASQSIKNIYRINVDIFDHIYNNINILTWENLNIGISSGPEDSSPSDASRGDGLVGGSLGSVDGVVGGAVGGSSSSSSVGSSGGSSVVSTVVSSGGEGGVLEQAGEGVDILSGTDGSSGGQGFVGTLLDTVGQFIDNQVLGVDSSPGNGLLSQIGDVVDDMAANGDTPDVPL